MLFPTPKSPEMVIAEIMAKLERRPDLKHIPQQLRVDFVLLFVATMQELENLAAGR